jgi:glycine C-acetyltransferase
MSDQAFYSGLQSKLDTLRSDGLFKPERVLASRQGA